MKINKFKASADKKIAAKLKKRYFTLKEMGTDKVGKPCQTNCIGCVGSG